MLTVARRDAVRTGALLAVMHDAEEAATGAHILYTDVWTSMGQEAEGTLCRAVFAPYRVDARLPAHRGEEVTDDVLDGPQSRVFAQAENRLHVQKAILRALVATEARVEALTA